ncbi:Rpn family recombination-promoting nuclease/putative transposase [Treponema sp. Marseille-Q4523]|uniref:Rpn family recombination-promoting nuclease/putative transposase n=1 Tax=Treponema TaxID=157 RepID=UPI00195F62C3|nr:Rpn family recombination-promoting nuclease/putative transposase [Treponema sp. Marseille-Q4523]MBM7022119.1 Rpn family recombination-promoting nuclease/putative transposase [Treponema sp. Marseille-Q4523]
MQKRFDDLTITDDYMFCAVMQDKSICTTVLNMVLADSIGPISDITYQKIFDQAGYAKGIRLDVWVTDSNGSVYDVEMQTTNQQDLAKRLRYYQSVIDVSSLEKGGHYTDLPDSFIIFFCPFDYLNRGLPVYTFKTVCSEDNVIVLADGVTKVIINSTAADKEPDPELKAFLEYMNGITSDSPFIRKIERYIKELKENEERRKEYMLIQAFEMDARKDGIQQGIQQGLRQGIQQGKSLGLAEGSRQKALETARILKQLGDSVKKIMQATGLSQEEVESIS